MNIYIVLIAILCNTLNAYAKDYISINRCTPNDQIVVIANLVEEDFTLDIDYGENNVFYLCTRYMENNIAVKLVEHTLKLPSLHMIMLVIRACNNNPCTFTISANLANRFYLTCRTQNNGVEQININEKYIMTWFDQNTVNIQDVLTYYTFCRAFQNRDIRLQNGKHVFVINNLITRSNVIQLSSNIFKSLCSVT